MIPVRDMHNFFDVLPPEIKAAFDAVSSYKKIAQDDMIIRVGDVRHEMYQICEGSAKCCNWDYQGRETVFTVVKSGDWIGISELFTDLPSLANVVALSPVTIRIVKDRDLYALMDTYPVIARQLLRLQSLRFCMVFHLDVDRTSLSLKDRLLKTLYMLSMSDSRYAGDQKEIAIAMSQEELSKLLVASRQKVNQALKELEREELVQISYGSIRLINLDIVIRRYGYLINVSEPASVYPS